MVLRMLFLAGLLLSVASCAHGRQGFIDKDGVKRAAFELSCPEGSLTITEINASTMGVEGCGQKAVYKLVQVNSGGGVDWVRD